MLPRTVRCLPAALLLLACLSQAAQPAPTPTTAERFDAAMTSFRQARMPEAYGRFTALANAGHAPSAEIALFMFQHGPALFGKDWDVTQEQLTAWAALNGRPAPVLQAHVYPRPKRLPASSAAP